MVRVKTHLVNRSLIIMGVVISTISCHQTPKKFITSDSHLTILERSLQVNANQLQQLDKYGVDENSGLALNIYFVTNDSLKAAKLAEELNPQGYHLNAIHPSSENHSLWVLTGSSPMVSMDEDVLNKWSTLMCETGFKHDCEFQGWNPVTE